MQELIKKLNELISIAEVRINKCEQEKSKNAAVKTALEAREKSVKIVEDALIDREKNVTIYENLGVAQKEIELDRNNNKEEADRLKQKEMSIDGKIASFDKKSKDAQTDIERQKEKLAKQSIEIDQKAKDYKKEVMAEITKQAGK